MINLIDDRDYRLWILLRHTFDMVFRARNKELEEFDITSRQAYLLHGIKVYGDSATIANLSKWMSRRPHTVGNMLITMEKEQLIEKTKLRSNKQSAICSLTEKGEQAFIKSTELESIHEVMSIFSEDDLQTMEKILRKLKDKAESQLIDDFSSTFP